MIKTIDDFINECNNDHNVVFRDKQNIKIGNRIYTVNIFGTKLSDKTIKNYFKTAESIMDKLKDN